MSEQLTLRQLEATFLRRDNSRQFQIGVSFEEADGVRFLCPVCFVANGNSNKGTHGIICWKPSVPQDTNTNTNPTPGRWDMQGTGIDDLTLVAGSSSVFLTTTPCKAHFHVQKGKIV